MKVTITLDYQPIKYSSRTPKDAIKKALSPYVKHRRKYMVVRHNVNYPTKLRWLRLTSQSSKYTVRRRSIRLNEDWISFIVEPWNLRIIDLDGIIGYSANNCRDYISRKHYYNSKYVYAPYPVNDTTIVKYLKKDIREKLVVKVES